MSAFQGGFDKNSGNNQSAQKQQQEKISQVTLPVNCFIVNQIRRGIVGNSATNHYDWGCPFENAIITAKYEFMDESGQQKIIGKLSDNTGYFTVVTQKPKDSDQLPEFLQAYQNELSNNNNRIKYVRAMIKMRKNAPIQLLYFSIVNDANEITRHNLDISLRYMQRTYGLEDFMNMTARHPAVGSSVQNQKHVNITINRSLPPAQQVLDYFKQITAQSSDHLQIPKKQINEAFNGMFNGPQINQYLQQLCSDNEIFYIESNDSYFLNK